MCTTWKGQDSFCNLGHPGKRAGSLDISPEHHFLVSQSLALEVFPSTELTLINLAPHRTACGTPLQPAKVVPTPGCQCRPSDCKARGQMQGTGCHAGWYAAMPRGQQPARSLSVSQPDHLSASDDKSHFMNPGVETNSSLPMPKHSNSKRQTIKLNCASKTGLSGKEPSEGIGLDPAEFSHPQSFKLQHSLLLGSEVNSLNRVTQCQRTSIKGLCLLFKGSQTVTVQHTYPGIKRRDLSCFQAIKSYQCFNGKWKISECVQNTGCPGPHPTCSFYPVECT